MGTNGLTKEQQIKIKEAMEMLEVYPFINSDDSSKEEKQKEERNSTLNFY